MENAQWNWNNNDQYYVFKASPIYDKLQGKLVLLIFYNVTDVNKRKENEIKLLKAETSLKSKIEFIASISHEIRTPLQAAMYSIDNLIQTNLNPLQKEFIDDIRSSNRLSSDIIGDILDLSKIEAERMEIKKGVVDT